MLKLPDQKSKDVDDYVRSIKPKVIKALKSSSLPLNARKFLTEDKIELILKSKPEKLIKIHREFIKSLGKWYNEIDYKKYFDYKKGKNKDASARKLVHKYNKIVIPLRVVFDYDKFLSKSKSISYSLATLLDRNTCTYCNRLYTITVIEKDKATSIYKTKDGITRPQFDHWFSKKKHPLLSLSFYNLIPCCSTCNSSVKLDDDYDLSTHVHPYIDSSQETFTFSYDKSSTNSSEVSIKVNGKKIDKTIQDLKIKEIYGAHAKYELQDLIDLKYKYSKNYLEILLTKSFDLSEVKKKDIYRMLFGVEMEEDKFHKRPFSKFKRDIIIELNKT